MYGLPDALFCKKLISRANLMQHSALNPRQKAAIEAEFGRLEIIAEISPRNTAIHAGEDIQIIYIMRVMLKKMHNTCKSMQLLCSLIPQSVIYIFTFQSWSQLALYINTHLLTGPIRPDPELLLPLRGVSLDDVWRHLARSLAGMPWHDELSIPQNLANRDHFHKIQKKLERLELRLKAEVQSHKKLEIFNEIREAQHELDSL